MNKVETEERFSSVLRKSRKDSGKSQEWIANELCVSKRTVQNWEEGLSSPSVTKTLEWFNALGLQPLPYYLEVIYPTEFENISPAADDKRIEEALIKYIKGTSTDEKRKLLFMLFGSHGSSPEGIINMITAHLHCELRARLNIAQNIITNYEIAEAHGTLVANDHIKPDMEILQKSLENAKQSVRRKENSYTNA